MQNVVLQCLVLCSEPQSRIIFDTADAEIEAPPVPDLCGYNGTKECGVLFAMLMCSVDMFYLRKERSKRNLKQMVFK